jgi:hypothetical protein
MAIRSQRSPSQYWSKLQLMFGFHQFIHKCGGCGEPDSELLPEHSNTQAGKQMSFAGSTGSEMMMGSARSR